MRLDRCSKRHSACRTLSRSAGGSKAGVKEFESSGSPPATLTGQGVYARLGKSVDGGYFAGTVAYL